MKRSKSLFPSISELLASPTVKPWIDQLHPAVVVAAAHGVIEETYEEMKSVATEFRMPDFAELANRIAARLTAQESEMHRPTINATGILFHSKYGSPPLPNIAVEQMVAACGQPVTPDLVESLFRELTGAEDVVILSGVAAAQLLVVTSLAQGKEIVIPRSRIVENSQHYRLIDLIAICGARLREVGTLNHTTLEDYAAAFSRDPGLVWFPEFAPFGTASPFLKENPEVAAVLELAKNRGVSTVCEPEFVPLRPLEFADTWCPPMSSVREILACGYDLLVFRGGQMIGGPDVGMIAGKKEVIGLIRKSPVFNAFQADSMMLAGMQATLSLYVGKDQQLVRAIPILELLSASTASIRNRATRIAAQLASNEAIASSVVEKMSVGILPDHPAGSLWTDMILVDPKHCSPEEMKQKLLMRNPAVAACVRTIVSGEVSRTSLSLSLLTVPAKYDPMIVEAFME